MNVIISLVSAGSPIPNQLQVFCQVICRVTSSHWSETVDWKTSPRNPI